jgi:prevent-host-death family protein
MDDKARIEPEETLDALLDRVERGEEVTIRRNGKPVARMVPQRAMRDLGRARAAAERIRGLTKVDLGMSISDAIDSGRR